MSRTHTFKVSKDENSPSHNVTVRLPDEFTDAQTANLVDEGIRSVTIKVQRTCRNRLAKGVRPGEALNIEAQKAFDAVINGVRVSSGGSYIDAEAIIIRPLMDAGLDGEALAKAARVQIDLLTAQGATVHNIPAGV